nr:mitochondrial import inner membrane translocase subunit TIM22-4-like isoform X1 [Nicotiana tomentosiformis]
MRYSQAQKPQIEPIRMPTVEEIRGQDIWNNCAVRSVVSGVMGGGLGLFMGLFLGALDNPIMQEEMTTRQQLVYQAKQMGRRSWSSCKTFAVMGLVFSAAECVDEKARAKHDMTNTAVAGCITGGTLSARGNICYLDHAKYLQTGILDIFSYLASVIDSYTFYLDRATWTVRFM